MADGDNRGRHKQRGARRICDLREGDAGLAQLAIKEGFFVLQSGRSVTVDVAQLMQHRALLSENQQQHKAKSHTNPTHVYEGSRYSRQ